MELILATAPSKDFPLKIIGSEKISVGWAVSVENISNEEWITLMTILANNQFAITALALINWRVNFVDITSLASALKTNKTLHRLNLSDQLVDNKGAKMIAEALKVNTALVHLSLSENRIGSSGACDLAKALETNKTLNYLELLKNNIGDAGANALAKTLITNISLQWLNLYYNSVSETILNTIDALCLRNRENPVSCANAQRKAGQPAEVPPLSSQLAFYITLQSNRHPGLHQNVLNKRLDQNSLSQIKEKKNRLGIN